MVLFGLNGSHLASHSHKFLMRTEHHWVLHVYYGAGTLQKKSFIFNITIVSLVTINKRKDEALYVESNYVFSVLTIQERDLLKTQSIVTQKGDNP